MDSQVVISCVRPVGRVDIDRVIHFGHIVNMMVY